MAELYSLQSLSAAVSVAEYLRECVDVEKFLGYCRECNNYGQRWACPSFDFDPLTVWRKYAGLRLIGLALIPKPEARLADMLAGLYLEKDKLHAQLLAQEQQNPGSLALSAGSCYLCGKECSRPLGQPCRQPEKMRYSIEALGGDVAKTAEVYLGKPLLWIRAGEMPEYLTLVGGLLLPEA